ESSQPRSHTRKSSPALRIGWPARRLLIVFVQTLGLAPRSLNWCMVSCEARHISSLTIGLRNDGGSSESSGRGGRRWLILLFDGLLGRWLSRTFLKVPSL